MTAMTAARMPTVGAKPLLATIVGIPVALIVLAAARGEPVPVVDSYEAGLVALFILGSAMCTWGMQAMASRYGYLRASAVGLPLGVVNLLLILSGLLGWTALVGPVQDALGAAGTVSAARASVVALGVVMAAKWAIAWLAYLPRALAGRSAPTGA